MGAAIGVSGGRREETMTTPSAGSKMPPDSSLAPNATPPAPSDFTVTPSDCPVTPPKFPIFPSKFSVTPYDFPAVRYEFVLASYDFIPGLDDFKPAPGPQTAKSDCGNGQIIQRGRQIIPRDEPIKWGSRPIIPRNDPIKWGMVKFIHRRHVRGQRNRKIIRIGPVLGFPPLFGGWRRLPSSPRARGRLPPSPGGTRSGLGERLDCPTGSGRRDVGAGV